MKIEDKRNLDKAFSEGKIGIASVIFLRISDRFVDKIFDEYNKKFKSFSVTTDKRRRSGFFPSPRGGNNSHKIFHYYRTTS